MNRQILRIEGDSIFLSEKPKRLIKDPKSLFQQYVEDLNKIRIGKSYVLYNLWFIINEFYRVIPNYNYIRGIELNITPSEVAKKEIKFLKKWFKENKESLYWDTETQQLQNKNIIPPRG